MSASTLERRRYDEVRFLIVDDDEVTLMSIRRAIKRMNLLNPVREARDGIEALEILHAAAGKEGKLPPYIVLLDINMPRMDGHEFLDIVRRDPVLHRVVIFVLTTSEASEDVLKAYDKNVAGYIVKDDLYETFNRMMELVDQYARLMVLPN